MTVEIRQLTAAEMGQLGELGGYVYGGSFGDGPDNVIATANAPEWTLCALVDGRLVSSFSAIPFTMRANGTAVPMAGVSTVGTQPEFRRQGLVRRIHTQAFADMRERGQTVASLWASQAAIYQRYGYAMTTVQRSYAVDSVDVGFYDGDGGLGDVRRTSVEKAYDQIKALYIQFIAGRMCYLHRAKPLWLQNALQEVDADGPIEVGISHDDSGVPNGYVIYSLRANKVDHRARSQGINVRDMVWQSQDAYRSLWSFLGRHDLVGRITYGSAAADDPAPTLFVEPRLLHTNDGEGIWLRVVDAARALETRGYGADGEINIALPQDNLTPWNEGVHRLEAGSDGARVTAGSSADLTMSAKTLALLYTGFESAQQLASWGLIEGDDDAVRRADAIFATAHMPHCPDHF